jgi:hypothetical protein
MGCRAIGWMYIIVLLAFPLKWRNACMTITLNITYLDQFLSIADTYYILNSNFWSRMSKYDTMYNIHIKVSYRKRHYVYCTFIFSSRCTVLCSVSSHVTCKWNKGPTYPLSEDTDQLRGILTKDIMLNCSFGFCPSSICYQITAFWKLVLLPPSDRSFCPPFTWWRK